MGIPFYFKTLVQEYQDSILIKNKLTSVQSLFLDLNWAIHPCCSGESDEEIMLNKIISKSGKTLIKGVLKVSTKITNAIKDIIDTIK